MLSDLSTTLAKAVMALQPETLTEVIQIPLQERIAINDSLSFIYPIGYRLTALTALTLSVTMLNDIDNDFFVGH